MKKVFILVLGALLVIGGIFIFKDVFQSKPSTEQMVIQQTLDISIAYASLRYQTDNVLINAKDYADYDIWKDELTDIIQQWGVLETSVSNLEQEANKLDQQKTSFHLTKQALAYNLQEAEQVISSAPPQKRIATLAKHYGVDAKMAQLILNQTADQMSSEAFAGEGNLFEQCEQNSMRIKNGAKVTVFVGTVVATGGTSALAASGTLAQTAVVVSGADLVLEVTEDEARIALGDKNKVSSMVSKMRSVTEPAAGILTVANISGNVSKAIDKFGVVSLGADQIRSVVQDEKILGISIKIDQKGETKTTIASLSKEELPQWKVDNNAPDSTQTIEEIIEQAKQASAVEPTQQEASEENQADVKQEPSKQASKTSSQNISNQIIEVKNVSGSSWMIDTCFTSTCWDDLDADPEEDRDLGGIYTLGKVFGNGEGFSIQFQVDQARDDGRLTETSANKYKITLYFALYPFEGPKNKIIEYGTWLTESVVISANYGEKPVIEWDGTTLIQK